MSTVFNLSDIPSVDELLRSESGKKWLISFSRRFVVTAIRNTLSHMRNKLINKEIENIDIVAIEELVNKELKRLTSYSLRPVINATGIVIHTNLGRAPLSEQTMRHVSNVATSYCTLEYDLEKGCRGKRNIHVQRLLREITGAEDAVIVNNNAAAVFLCLIAIAKAKEVIVSRGELVEIGGSFRVPDVMSASGAILKEVGTTNKTHSYDYEKAISSNTGLLLKVHQSNFRILGFTKDVSINELVDIGKRHKIPVMYDLGSGSLINSQLNSGFCEPTVQDIIKSGCDIVTFSGDKLLGGPQGGIIAGKRDFIQQIASHPLMRALRIDKMTLAAFESVLMNYADQETVMQKVPTLNMLSQDIVVLKQKAQVFFNDLLSAGLDKYTEIHLKEDNSQAGGGSLPEMFFKTIIVALKPFGMSVNQLEQNLRFYDTPIITRIADDAVVFDVRTIKDSEFPVIIFALKNVLK